MDPLKELEEIANKGDRVNFIPCVAWVQREVAKSNPDKVIEQTNKPNILSIKKL